MTLQDFLKKRKWFEALVIAGVLILVAATNATSIIIESHREGIEISWLLPLATEYTATLTIPLLFPLLFPFLRWLNLNFNNFRWRVLWHIPGFLVFSLSHIALFVLARKLLWPLAGMQYEFGPVFLGLIYEMRKVFWVYLILIVAYYGYRFILDRLQGEAKFLSSTPNSIQQAYKDQFLVKMLDKEFLVRVDEIDWIQSASNYVLLTCGERQYPMRQTLAGLASQLDPDKFMRVHRTTIVNLSQVETLQSKGEARILLRNGHSLPISKTYVTQLRQTLESAPKI